MWPHLVQVPHKVLLYLNIILFYYTISNDIYVIIITLKLYKNKIREFIQKKVLIINVSIVFLFFQKIIFSE